MIALMIKLSQRDIAKFKIRDDYALHKLVYSLFDRSLENSGRILYADKGGKRGYRRILALSDREPLPNTLVPYEKKTVPPEFLNYNKYAFEIELNPVKRDKQTGKLIPVTKREEIKEWFTAKAERSLGFMVYSGSLDVRNISVKRFNHRNGDVTIESALLTGVLQVTDRGKFLSGFKNGIGKGKAFGLGLLQLMPLE